MRIGFCRSAGRARHSVYQSGPVGQSLMPRPSSGRSTLIRWSQPLGAHSARSVPVKVTRRKLGLSLCNRATWTTNVR